MNKIAKKSGRVEKEDGTYINEADYLDDTTDAFGMKVAQNPSNVADMGSHYRHTPERQRLYINGTRFNLQYNTTAKFEDASDYYSLKPAVGDIMEYRTAERYRYAVGYVIVPSTALMTNQPLQGNDKVIYGYGDIDLENDRASSNGWFWEWDSNGLRLTTYRDGTRLTNESVTPAKAITIWQRIEDRINWYNAGNREARQTYTEDGRQFNDLLGKTSVDGQRGPSSGNHPVSIAVEAESAGLELEIGSIGVKLFGTVDPIYRIKESVVTESHTGGGQWEPLFAIRRNPLDPNVYMNISDIQISQLSQDGDVELMALAVDPSNTDASGFSTSIYHSESNSAIEETSTITTFPDSTGTPQTSATNPGGFQVGFTAYYVAGTGTANRRTTATKGTRKRPVSDGDYIVFIAKTSTAMQIRVTYETEQQY